MEIAVEVLSSPRLRSYLENAPDGVTVLIPPLVLHRSFGHDDTTTLIIQFGTGVAGNLVAAWIFEKFKEKRPKKTAIRDVEIPWDKAELTRIIKEELEKEAKSDADAQKDNPKEEP